MTTMRDNGTATVWLGSLICLLEHIFIHVAVSLVSLIALFYSIYSFKEDPEKTALIFYVGSESLVFLHALKAVHFIVYRKNDFKKFQCKIQTIAQRLRVIPSSRTMNLLIIVGIVFHIGGFILEWNLITIEYDDLVGDLIPWFISIFYVYLSICQIGVYLILPERCLHNMHAIVSSSIDRDTNNEYLFDVLVSYYDVLLEFCEKVNQWFDEQLLFVIGFCFFGVLGDFTQSKMLRAFQSEQVNEEVGYWLFIALTYYGSIVLTLILMCYFVTNKAEKFNKSLTSLVMRDRSGKVASSPYIQAHFAISRKFQFSVFGIFYINSRFGYTILAGIMTCLFYFKGSKRS